MDMMTITQLAQQTDLAPPTVRRYLDDFILYVPSVRVDGTIGFPPEAVTVINTIHALMERGHSHSEILAKLEAVYPITVISAQPLAKLDARLGPVQPLHGIGDLRVHQRERGAAKLARHPDVVPRLGAGAE